MICVKNQHEFGIVRRGMSSNENTSKMSEMDSNETNFKKKYNYTIACSVDFDAMYSTNLRRLLQNDFAISMCP